jgi:ABC-type nickel/cobalt efflux system permease component RcnA
LSEHFRRLALPRLAVCFAVFVASLVLELPAWPHDIPNQRVDRSTQATIRPGRLEIDYEVSLSELTLTQDLRALIGTLPGADRTLWLARYAEVTGPLNAKGFLIAYDGRPVPLSLQGYDLTVEEHPRYTFHFQAPLPEKGVVTIHDTNYASSEGTSRLAIRARDGSWVQGDDLPPVVEEIPIRPLWQLDDAQERRTRFVQMTFRSPELIRWQDQAHRPAASAGGSSGTWSELKTTNLPSPGQLSRLLDHSTRGSWLGLFLVAAALGAIHAIQPGHGKTLVTAVAIGSRSRAYYPALLGLATTLAHTGGVLLLAAILWWTGASQVAAIHQGLLRVAGFVIAAGGLWRVGHYLGQGGECEHARSVLSLAEVDALSPASLIGLGIAGGLVPCWDAVGLLVLSAAIGRLPAGVFLVLSFGVGMAGILVAVGVLAAWLKSAMMFSARARAWESQLGLASGLMLAVIGLVFFLG